MKKLLSIAVLLTAFAGMANAQVFMGYASGGIELYYTVNSDDTSVTVTGYEYAADYQGTRALDIPSSATHNYRTYSVTAIGNAALEGCYMTQVTIPNSVTRIDTHAFAYCHSLASITIGNAVPRIPNYAFYDCSSLTHVAIPNSVTIIDTFAFGLCTSLVNIALGSSVTHIHSYAFYDCSSLASIVIPNAVEYIGGRAFYNCTSLASVAFNADSCTSMAYVLDDGSFIPAFRNCTQLTTLTIGDNVKIIPDYAFTACSGLTDVDIPDAVKSIGFLSFYNCTGLTRIGFGNSVTNIGKGAFYGCTQVAEITSRAATAPLLDTGAFYGIADTIPVNIPCGSIDSYQSRWEGFSNFVETPEFRLEIYAADSAMGSVQVLTAPTCANPEAVLYAEARPGYRFDHWSDGDTANPRQLVLTQDTLLTAYFLPEGSGEGISPRGSSQLHIFVQEGCIVVEGADQELVRLYDITGRLLQQRKAEGTLRLHVPQGGAYLVQAGDRAAQKIVAGRCVGN